MHQHGAGRTFNAAEFSVLVAAPQFQVLIRGDWVKSKQEDGAVFVIFKKKKVNKKKGGGL